MIPNRSTRLAGPGVVPGVGGGGGGEEVVEHHVDPLGVGQAVDADPPQLGPHMVSASWHIEHVGAGRHELAGGHGRPPRGPGQHLLGHRHTGRRRAGPLSHWRHATPLPPTTATGVPGTPAPPRRVRQLLTGGATDGGPRQKMAGPANS